MPVLKHHAFGLDLLQPRTTVRICFDTHQPVAHLPWIHRTQIELQQSNSR